MSFVDKLKGTLDDEFNVSVTEKGALGYRTTGKALVDLNFMMAHFRSATDEGIIKYFTKAFHENKFIALKYLFFAGDVRGGLGERRFFRVCLKFLAESQPEIAKKLLPLVAEYTRWDNLLVLLDTELKDDVCSILKAQIDYDIQKMQENKSISLCAKWLPSVNSSSKLSKTRAKIIISNWKIKESEYRKILSKLRAYLKVIEVQMSRGEWSTINYEQVPSRANLIYNGAFLRNDEERRRDYLSKLEKGEAKINSGVLFPHDIVHSYIDSLGWKNRIKKKDVALEEMWKGLPNYVEGANNTICVLDGSGSMCISLGKTNVRAIDVGTALAIYFSERCSGEFKDKFITFSENPQLVDLSKCKTLRDKIEVSFAYDEVANTNIEAVFDLILTTAVKSNMKQSDMPKNILILSDMEFDVCVETSHFGTIVNSNMARLFDVFAQKFAQYGYNLPRLVFWNINSRSGTIPVKENMLGVALVSGFSTVIAKMVLSEKLDPYDCIVEQLNTERYEPVAKAIKGVK